MSNFRSVPGMMIVSVFCSWQNSESSAARICRLPKGPLILHSLFWILVLVLLLSRLRNRILPVRVRLDGRIAVGAGELVDAGAGFPVRLEDLVVRDGLARVRRHASHGRHEARLHAARDF